MTYINNTSKLNDAIFGLAIADALGVPYEFEVYPIPLLLFFIARETARVSPTTVL